MEMNFHPHFDILFKQLNVSLYSPDCKNDALMITTLIIMKMIIS
jgi:hypothetical protein